MKYVYILESLDSDHFYVGITDDLRARLTKHNAGEVNTHVEIPALEDKNLRRIQRREKSLRVREVFEVSLRSRVCEKALLMIYVGDESFSKAAPHDH